jgi:hypothetical protein
MQRSVCPNSWPARLRGRLQAECRGATAGSLTIGEKPAPRHALENRELDVLETSPRPPAPDHLRLEEPDHGLRQGVVVGIPLATHRRLDPGLGQPLGVANRQVLHSAVAVVNRTLPFTERPVVERLLKGVRRKVAPQRARNAPSDDSPRVGVDHEGDVGEAAPGCDVGQVRDPQLVRPTRPEVPLDQIRRTGSLLGPRRRLERADSPFVLPRDASGPTPSNPTGA